MKVFKKEDIHKKMKKKQKEFIKKFKKAGPFGIGSFF
jgi:hypothetical protein